MSINITISIDGGVVSATTVSPESMTATSPETTHAGAAPDEMELSRMVGVSNPSINQNVPVAKAGDISAGAAPSEIQLSRIAGLASPSVEQNIPIVEVGDIAAGSAPNFPPTER